MASFNLSIAFDAYESKRHRLPLYSAQPPDRCSVHRTDTQMPNSLTRLRRIKVSRLDAEVSDDLESNLAEEMTREDVVTESLIEQGPSFGRHAWRNGKSFQNSRPKAIKKISRKRVQSKCSLNNPQVVDQKEVDVSLPHTALDLSSEQCNGILKRLESDNDIRSLRFFERMRSTGKLKHNTTAYNLILRVLGRRADWDAAEAIIWEMRAESGCELNLQVMNTMIYACYKQGCVKLGAKWFRLMLENGVQPNIATFGMLMSLYQKGWDLEEAEFTFSQMRICGIRCESAYSAMITIYTRMRLYAKAEEIIGALREDNVTLNSENWLVLLNTYSQQGKLEDAELTLSSMREAGFPPNLVAYNTLITGYGKLSNMDAAERLFHDIQNAGLEPDETTYRSMIEGWGRADNYEEAIWYYKELRRLRFKPNPSNLYTMIHLHAKHEDEEGASQIIEDMMTMGCQYSSILGTLLNAYERVGRIDRVPAVLRGSLYDHVLANQISCSILLTAYVKYGLVVDTIQILREKQWKDSTFEQNLYHLMICSCKELGQLENAVKLYIQMPKSDKPNMHIMSTMIDIYTIMGLFSEAEAAYITLKSSGIVLDVVALSIVVKMYVKAGSLNDACLVFETFNKEKNLVPDVYLFRDMLRIYQKCGKLDKLESLYYKILKSGIVWDQEMYICVINCCSHALPIDELSRLFDEMLQLGYVPTTTTINVMLHVYGKNGLLTRARKVFWMGKKRGLIDVISYNTLIAAYGQNKDFNSMSSTIQKMELCGFSISLEAYNCMLDAYGKDGQLESFRNVLQRMKAAKCASDHYTYNIMINIYGEHAWIEEVAEVLRELKESGLGPDLCSYNTLIKAYGIAGMVEDAAAVVKEMRENGIEPDRITYTNLIAALRKNDKFLEAVKWSLWMKQMGL